MAQKYKVFINNKAVFFHINEVNTNNFKNNCVLYSEDKIEIESFIESNQLMHNEIHVIGRQSMQNYFNDFKKINAAGGVVFNVENDILFIFRNNKWDLPKGKIEVGESIEEGAVREVEEECGVDSLELKELISTTYHTYEMFNEKCFKTTYWYRMISDFKGVLVPQLEEGITKVDWLSLEEMSLVKENTYPSIIDVLESI